MKRLFKLFKNEKGFTLIELIVVIAVLGMIAAIAIPKVGNISGNAKNKADEQTITILNEAVQRYKAHNGVVPGDSDKTVINKLQNATADEGGPYLGSDIVEPEKADDGVELPSGDLATYDSSKEEFTDPDLDNTK